MQPEGVVEAHDVVSNVRLRFCMVGIVALPNPLHLEIQEEALHHGINAPMSSKGRSIFQIGQDERVQLTNDVAFQTTVNLLL